MRRRPNSRAAASALPGGIFVAAALVVCVPLAWAQSVQLFLRNGDRLTGTVLSEDPVRLTLSNAILGRVVIPVAQVERREGATNGVLAAKAPGAPAPATNAPAGAAAPIMRRQLNELLAAHLAGEVSSREYQRLAARLTNGPGRGTPPRPPGPKHWSGEAQLGADLGFSQKERQLYSGRLKLGYAQAPVRNNFDYLFTYGRTDGDLAANRMDGTMKTDYDLRDPFYLYSLAGAGYDEIRKIDLRYEVGPGLGYQVIKRTNFVLRVESGFHYEAHDFEDHRQDDAFYHRLAQDLKWNLGTAISLDEKVEYLPQLDASQDYKLRVEANVRLWLRSNLFLNLTMIDLYDTVTAQGVGQNDLQLRSTVGVRF